MDFLQISSSNARNYYRGHMFWLPAVRFPSRVFPIFLAPDDQCNNAFLEVGDKAGRTVSGYIKFGLDFLHLRFRPKNGIGNSWIGAPLRQYVAFSRDDIHEFGSLEQLKQEIMNLVLERDTEISSSNPFFGLEIARFVEDEMSEILFSARSASAIAKRSTRVARKWAESAPLSDLARESAFDAINRIHNDLELGDLPETEVYCQTLNFFHLHQRSFSRSMSVTVCEGVKDLSNRIWTRDVADRSNKVVVFLTLRDWIDLARYRLPPRGVEFHVFARSNGPEKELAQSPSEEQVTVHYWSNSMEIDEISYDLEMSR